MSTDATEAADDTAAAPCTTEFTLPDGQQCVIRAQLHNGNQLAMRDDVDNDAAQVLRVRRVGGVHLIGSWSTTAVKRVAMRVPYLQDMQAVPQGPLSGDLFQHNPNLTRVV